MSDAVPWSIRWLRWALGAVAFVVIVEAALGFLGATRAALPVIGGAAAAAGALAVRAGWRAASRHERGDALETADLWALLALTVALATRLAEGLHHAGGAFTYDVLSYHLHLPASWLAAGRVSVVPTPFGDQAPAYAPANAELTYLLALASTGNLRLAHAGQAAYAALAALAIVATSRQLGVSRRLACGAALAFLMLPEVWQQAAGAMADLALASFVLACLPFLLRLHARGSVADLLALGAGLGLVIGTKYVGAVLVLPLLAAAVLVIAPGGDRHAWPRAWGAAIVAVLALACGGFWYVRNTVLTADPTFPVTLRVAGLTIGHGLYGAPEMRQWLYHLPRRNLQPLLEMFAETGWGFLACLIGGLIAIPRRWRALATGLFGAYVALGWLVVPYQQSRFLFAAWGIGALAAAAAAAAVRRTPLRELALAPAIAGAALQYPTVARLLAAGIWIMSATLGARGQVADQRQGARPFEGMAVWLGPPALGLVALALIVWTGRPAHTDPQLARIGDGHDAGWAYTAAHPRGRHIAYTGSNLPLPLWGWNLENRVRYVNVAGNVGQVLHDFRTLAASPTTAEPAPERARPDRNAWLTNLTAASIDTLFVARLYPEVAASMPHDGDGFPTERAWADELPERFHLAFATDDVRIYDVRSEAKRGRSGPGTP